MKFLDKLKSVSLKFHTSPQLRGKFQMNWTDEKFLSYLSKKRTIHKVFNSTDIHPSQRAYNFENELWVDIQSLDIDAVKDQDTFYSDYLEYLVKSGEREALFCHYYNFIFAHMTGGGRAIFSSAVPYLPSYHDSVYFVTRDPGTVERMKEELEEVASNWTSSQRLLCLKEAPVAFDMAMNLFTSDR